MKQTLNLCLSIFVPAFLIIASLSTLASASCSSEYEEVGLGYLAAHLEDFSGQKVRTTGTVSEMISFRMYEDFWLNKVIQVVVRFSGLSEPLENSSIEICGTIEYCKLEGGFHYLNAHSWTYAEQTTPEFPSLVIFPLLMAATLLILMIRMRKKNSNAKVQ
jgi:hypothetical protein